jgi:hypothetical protein
MGIGSLCRALMVRTAVFLRPVERPTRVSGLACAAPPPPVPKGVAPFQPYLGATLKQGDHLDYSAAGLLAYRVSESGTIDVLLGRQMARGKGHSRRGTWSFIGGKREEDESCSIATAARETHEESMVPSKGWNR